MRFDGKIKIWNDEKGFGFISPLSGGQDVFVHISEIRHSAKPQVGDLLSFELELNPQGKKRAVRVRGAAQAAGGVQSVPRRETHRPVRASRSGHSSRSVLKRVMVIVLSVLLLWQGYIYYGQNRSGATPVMHTPALLPTVQPSVTGQSFITGGSFSCDGRQHCSQMTSCEEAKQFLKNCPDMKMDGDNDGIPCEEQLCRGGLR